MHLHSQVFQEQTREQSMEASQSIGHVYGLPLHDCESWPRGLRRRVQPGILSLLCPLLAQSPLPYTDTYSALGTDGDLNAETEPPCRGEGRVLDNGL